MSPRPTQPEALFDRTWRPRHPLRRRLSWLRRWGALAVLVALFAIIGGYAWLTDSQRVRAMAGAYLSQLLGGKVEIDRARLSLFEGLRLDGVRLKVDSPGADSTLFFARTFFLRYNPYELLAGRLQATQIIAIEPTVNLSEDPVTHQWNYQRLHPAASQTRPRETESRRSLLLPEIILRDAQIRYWQVHDGKVSPVGWFGMEGRFSPSSDANRYDFAIQSRSLASLGPQADGTFHLDTGQITASLWKLQFSPELMAMLPAEVRQALLQHGLQGRLDIPEMNYLPGRHINGVDTQATFHVKMAWRDVEMTVAAREWTTQGHARNVQLLHDTLDWLGRRRWISAQTAGQVRRLSTAEPVHFHQVSGDLDFTERGISIIGINGRIENNWLNVDGHIDGYSPDAPASIHLWSAQGHDLQIPLASPGLLGSLPPDVQNVYEQLRPQGTCRLSVTLDRPQTNGKIDLSGRVDIVQGAFQFNAFPYPLRDAGGAILIGYDGVEKCKGIRIVDVQGHGLESGPNRDATVRINGFLGPLDDVLGAKIDIQGINLSCEPAIRQALPRDVDKALALFDPQGKGLLPQFHGSFLAHLFRPPGKSKKWTLSCDFDIDGGEARLIPFPYPLKDFTARIEVRDGYLNIVNGSMRHGDSSLSINGKVVWDKPRPPDAPHLPHLRDNVAEGPTLHIVARNVPVDRDLLQALPPAQSQWLAKYGVHALLDVDGNISPGGIALSSAALPAAATFTGTAPASRQADVNYLMALAVHDGSIWPAGDEYSLTHLAGQLWLTPREIAFPKITATRGDATLTCMGTLDWSSGPAILQLDAHADQLAMEPGLFRALPADAQAAWLAINPQGTLDAQLSLRANLDSPATGPAPTAAANGELTNTSHSEPFAPHDTPSAPPARADSALPSADAAGAGIFQLTLHPRHLSVKPLVFPYALDLTGGTAGVQGDQVTLAAITGHHGESAISISGNGTLSRDPNWLVHLSAKNLAVDDDLRKGLPSAITDLCQSLNLSGKMDVELSRFSYRATTRPAGAGAIPVAGGAGSDPTAATAATPRPPTPNHPSGDAATIAADSGPAADIDVAARIKLLGNSLQAGVAMTDVTGSIDVAALVRAGKLHRLQGRVDSPKLTIAGHPAAHFKANIDKAADDATIRITHVAGNIADGDLAGDIALTTSDSGQSGYDLSLILRDLDVRQLTQSNDQQLSGRFTGSLILGGLWSDNANRRGHGDVRVSGHDMYNVPMLLGLLQITNLALPISSPLSDASARYSVDGSRIAIERLDIRGKDMTMSGSGTLDFDKRTVNLSLVTDNPNILAIPVLGPLINQAHNELLRIHVKGTIQKPTVSATSFDTVTTTVDQVLRGDDQK